MEELLKEEVTGLWKTEFLVFCRWEILIFFTILQKKVFKNQTMWFLGFSFTFCLSQLTFQHYRPNSVIRWNKLQIQWLTNAYCPTIWALHVCTFHCILVFNVFPVSLCLQVLAGPLILCSSELSFCLILKLFLLFQFPSAVTFRSEHAHKEYKEYIPLIARSPLLKKQQVLWVKQNSNEDSALLVAWHIYLASADVSRVHLFSLRIWVQVSLWNTDMTLKSERQVCKYTSR